MLEVGLSTCGFLFNDENFKALANAGIKNIEISREFFEYNNFDFQEIKRLSQTYGVNLWSFHLPFADTVTLDISSCNNQIRKKTVALWCEYIKKASEIGIKIFVAHPSSEPVCLESEARRENIECSKKSLKELAEFAAKYDAVIAVEDLPRSCLGNTADEILELISVDERLKVCFDTNHLLIDNNLNFIEKLGDRIITVHVSDYDFIDEKHWLPGEGKVDWHELYTSLLNKGYTGPWLYEIGLETPSTIQRKRNLLFSDFYKNAMQIFQNKINKNH